MIYAATTHATLLARLSGGEDRTAWDEFCLRYGELILSFARRQNLQPADCDDVVQEVMLALTKSMPGFRYDPTKGKFRSYLKTVVLHAVFRSSRQKQGQHALGEMDGEVKAAENDADLDAIWEEEWRQYHLRQALRVVAAEFSESDRTAFEQYAIQGRDARETAELLGMSVDQVYQAKSRILKRLSKLIAAQVEEEG